MDGALVGEFIGSGRLGDGSVKEAQFALGIKGHPNGTRPFIKVIIFELDRGNQITRVVVGTQKIYRVRLHGSSSFGGFRHNDTSHATAIRPKRVDGCVKKIRLGSIRKKYSQALDTMLNHDHILFSSFIHQIYL